MRVGAVAWSIWSKWTTELGRGHRPQKTEPSDFSMRMEKPEGSVTQGSRIRPQGFLRR